jgi:hypothetical protein
MYEVTCTYVNGKKHGPYRAANRLLKKSVKEYNYYEGVKHGPQKQW